MGKRKRMMGRNEREREIKESEKGMERSRRVKKIKDTEEEING